MNPSLPIQYPFPLRPGMMVTIELPADLTVAEAERVCRMVKSLGCTGAERYLDGRLSDPEYAEAYNAADPRAEPETIELPDWLGGGWCRVVEREADEIGPVKR